MTFFSGWRIRSRDRRLLSGLLLPLVAAIVFLSAHPAGAQSPQLQIVYPLEPHETTSTKVFLIGTAPRGGEVLVNGQRIDRHASGHFAPSFPLQVGKNTFTVRYGDQELQRTVTRIATTPSLPAGTAFAPGSLLPAVDLERQVNEPICFSAIAPQGATVTVRLANQPEPIPLTAQATAINLPPNYAVLTAQNQPNAITTVGTYQGCTRLAMPGDYGQPQFELRMGNQQAQAAAPGRVKILSPSAIAVATVTVDSGTARTGPSTDYSRLTPLPKGTQASVTGSEGEWLRLDYGAWIRRSEVQVQPAGALPTSLIRSAKSRQAGNWTEIVFPLQVPVPVTVQQSDRRFTLILHNTTAQTDIIRIDDDPVIERLDWYQPAPQRVEYVFNLKLAQQWGYTLRYEGTSLILALRHPPRRSGNAAQPLAGKRILLDPGHGGPEDLGARGPTGIPEKDVALKISQLVQRELQQRGATVIMTRDRDVDVGLRERMDAIANQRPDIALSLHYNALPDDGDAINTQGIAAFWYHAQAHSLAVFLHNYLTQTLKRPSYGIYWNNLALTRPTVAPTVLLELGFMINPDEFEWIINPQAQQRLAGAIADGVVQWFASRS